jgi:chemotaxis-related protein WspB
VADDVMLILTFKLGPNWYAIEATQVVELVPRVALRPIPHAPALLAGLLAYRGKFVPVIDLGLLVGTASCADRLSTRIILVKNVSGDENRGKAESSESVQASGPRPVQQERGPTLLGLIAEEASDLASVEVEQLRPVPVRLPQAPYLDAVVQTDRGILQLLTVAKVREAVLREGVSGQEPVASPRLVVDEPRMWNFEEREAENQSSGDERCGDG